MTPTQLRAYTAVVRLGSIKAAAVELGVSESAVSFNIAQLRKELGDALFTRHSAGLSFTPGGLRLAARGAELLGLQDRTVAEVSQAATGRRMLRVATSSLFGEYAAPGLIDLFTARAADLDVELSSQPPTRFVRLLMGRAYDAAIGPRPADVPPEITCTPFLNYSLVLVAAPSFPLPAGKHAAASLRDQVWCVGPSAATGVGLVPEVLRTVRVPEANQRIFQSHAAATDEARRGGGIALALAFSVAKDLAAGTLRRVETPALSAARGSWVILRRADKAEGSAADELARFVASPRAMQAMIRGSGVSVGRFRPSIHVTIWS